MFIKKDPRKIPTILADASKKSKNDSNGMNDDASSSSKLIDLPLQRRKSEFRGSFKILCQPSNTPSLCQLQSLSHYMIVTPARCKSLECSNHYYIECRKKPSQ
jgi:hypothetical protein